MAVIREFEEHSNQAYLRGVMPGLIHASTGQEAVPTGVCMELQDDDYVTSNHRGHGHCIAKGVEVRVMAAEILGKVEGVCRGKGGSMHIADLSKNMLGANGIVAGGVAMAAGAAFSAKHRETEQVSVVFIGDGAMNEGVTFETMNMAALWNLPVVFVCENNKFSEYTRMESLTAGTLVGRAAAFGIPTEVVDGQEVTDVSQAAARALARARSGEGPTFLEMNTYRYYGHHVADDDPGYRRPDEDEEFKERDPLTVHAKKIIENGWADAPQLAERYEDARLMVEEAYEWAKEGSDPSVDEVYQHVFAEVGE
jgi:TPP-dependent pyruvate/acetoin dehydrogenase alpha subunit